MKADDYIAFLEAKRATVPTCGFEIEPEDVSPACKPHVRAIVPWMVRKGRAACFSSFGLQKTTTQLEAVRITREHAGGDALIVCPLGVRQEFRRDATEVLGWSEPPRFIRTTEEMYAGGGNAGGIYLTNWESVRERKIDPRRFNTVTFDEADALRSFGSKTFGEVVIGPWHDVPYRYVASATPDPNDYLELLGYAQFLGVMDIGQAKTRFFKRNSEKADSLTLHVHKEPEFWRWVASWALVIQTPSDLGFSDEGYVMPPLKVRWHEIPSDHTNAGEEKSGQKRLRKGAALGVTHAAREKRESMPARMAKLMELRAERPDAHRLIWHDLEAERHAIEEAVPGIVTVYGKQDPDDRDVAVARFAKGEDPELASKPVLLGAGTNLQRFCAWEIFLGIGFKFRDLIQGIHRVYRFGQTADEVFIDLIYTEAERDVRRQLEEKWERYNAQTAHLAGIIRELGLAQVSQASLLTRSIGVERREVSGKSFRLVNNDCVQETSAMEDESVDLEFTSPPFSTQYEYTPSYNDFGHTDSTEHFWAQMEFLIPELLRVLRPGRNLIVHMKDRVVPSGMTGLGFQVVTPFHAQATERFTTCPECRYRIALESYRRAVKYGVTTPVAFLAQPIGQFSGEEPAPCTHRFAFLGMKTIVTDVVRENAQTYRLGYTEQCKDGSRMGAGLPEYLLIFRKPQTDRSRGYADVPVVKSKAEYSRGRWQFDAHGFMRSSGNRLLTPDEITRLPWRSVFRLFRQMSATEVYDNERDVALADAIGKGLPPDFMLLQPVSWHPDVWTDVVRMQTLNGKQTARARDKHLCPFPLDIVRRVIRQYSQPGESVYDPFCGLGSVPVEAVKLGRYGRGCELNPAYFADSVAYTEAAEREASMPTLFAMTEEEESDMPESAAVVNTLTGCDSGIQDDGPAI